MQWSPVSKLLIIGGACLIVLGLLWQFSSRFFPFLGRLPGDIVIERENFRLYFPIATMILISIALSILISLLARLLNRK